MTFSSGGKQRLNEEVEVVISYSHGTVFCPCTLQVLVNKYGKLLKLQHALYVKMQAIIQQYNQKYCLIIPSLADIQDDINGGDQFEIKVLADSQATLDGLVSKVRKFEFLPPKIAIHLLFGFKEYPGVCGVGGGGGGGGIGGVIWSITLNIVLWYLRLWLKVHSFPPPPPPPDPH